MKEGGFAWRFNVPVLHATLQDVVGHIELGLNTLPALFIRGSESDYVSDDDLDLLEDHFLHMDHHTIQGAGHWLHAQAPRRILRRHCRLLGVAPSSRGSPLPPVMNPPRALVPLRRSFCSSSGSCTNS